LSNAISVIGRRGSRTTRVSGIEREDRARARVQDRHRADGERTAARLTELDRGPFEVIDRDLPEDTVGPELLVGARLRDDEELRLLPLGRGARLRDAELDLAVSRATFNAWARSM